MRISTCFWWNNGLIINGSSYFICHPKLKRMSKQQNKKRKLEHSSQFTDPEDIRKSFRAQNPDVVVKGRVAQVSSLSNNSSRRTFTTYSAMVRGKSGGSRYLRVMGTRRSCMYIVLLCKKKKDDIRQRGRLTSFDLLTGNTKFSPAFSEKWNIFTKFESSKIVLRVKHAVDTKKKAGLNAKRNHTG